jgi:hypothetical protein
MRESGQKVRQGGRVPCLSVLCALGQKRQHGYELAVTVTKGEEGASEFSGLSLVFPQLAR